MFFYHGLRVPVNVIAGAPLYNLMLWGICTVQPRLIVMAIPLMTMGALRMMMKKRMNTARKKSLTPTK